jgi:hypothetical protein
MRKGRERGQKERVLWRSLQKAYLSSIPEERGKSKGEHDNSYSHEISIHLISTQ